MRSVLEVQVYNFLKVGNEEENKQSLAGQKSGKKFTRVVSDVPSVLVNRETIPVSVVDDPFEKPLPQQLQSGKQRWNEFSSTEQNELAIIRSATSVPNFQNQCVLLITELDGAFSNYCCVMKNTLDNAVCGLFTQLQGGRT